MPTNREEAENLLKTVKAMISSLEIDLQRLNILCDAGFCPKCQAEREAEQRFLEQHVGQHYNCGSGVSSGSLHPLGPGGGGGGSVPAVIHHYPRTTPPCPHCTDFARCAKHI